MGRYLSANLSPYSRAVSKENHRPIRRTKNIAKGFCVYLLVWSASPCLLPFFCARKVTKDSTLHCSPCVMGLIFTSEASLVQPRKGTSSNVTAVLLESTTSSR